MFTIPTSAVGPDCVKTTWRDSRRPLTGFSFRGFLPRNPKEATLARVLSGDFGPYSSATEFSHSLGRVRSFICLTEGSAPRICQWTRAGMVSGETPGAIILDRLIDLGPGVHDEGTVLHDWLADGACGEQQGSGRIPRRSQRAPALSCRARRRGRFRRSPPTGPSPIVARPSKT